MTSPTEGPIPEDDPRPDQPVLPAAQIVPLGGDGDGGTGLDAQGPQGEDEIAHDLTDIASPVESRTTVPDRGRRAVMAFVALLFSVELITLGIFVVVGAIKIADDPALATAQSFDVFPGEQLLSHLDLIRVLGFFATLIVAMAVLMIAIKGLLREVRRRRELATRLERLCLITATVGNLAASGIAIAVSVQAQNWYNSTGAPSEPERNWQAVGWQSVEPRGGTRPSSRETR